MKQIICIAIFLSGSSCSYLPRTVVLEELPQIGQEFGPEVGYLPSAETRMYSVTVADVEYAVVVGKKTGKVESIITNDEAFTSPDGVRIGETWSKLVEAGASPERGWGRCVARLPSGWRAVFTEQAGESCETLREGSTVNMYDLFGGFTLRDDGAGNQSK
jgi:hypothetical protein